MARAVSSDSSTARQIIDAAGLGLKGADALGVQIPGGNYAGSLLSLAKLLTNPSLEGAGQLGISSIPTIGRLGASLMENGLSDLGSFGFQVPEWLSGLGNIGNSLANASSLAEIGSTLGTTASSIGASLAAMGPSIAAGMMSLFAGGGPLSFLDAKKPISPAEHARYLRSQLANKLMMGTYDKIDSPEKFVGALPQQAWGASLGDSLSSMLNPRHGMYDMTESGQLSRPGNLSTSYIDRNNASVRDTMPDLSLFPLMDLLHGIGYRGSAIDANGVGTIRELDWDPETPNGVPMLLPGLPASRGEHGRGGVQEMIQKGYRIGPGAHPQTEAPRSLMFGGMDLAPYAFSDVKYGVPGYGQSVQPYEEPNYRGVPVTEGYQAWEPTFRNLASIASGQPVGARSPFAAQDLPGFWQGEAGEGTSGFMIGGQTQPWEMTGYNLGGDSEGSTGVTQWRPSARAQQILSTFSNPNSPNFLRQADYGLADYNPTNPTGLFPNATGSLKMKPLYYDGPERDVPLNVLMKGAQEGGLDPLYMYELQEIRPQSYSTWTNFDTTAYPQQEFREAGAGAG